VGELGVEGRMRHYLKRAIKAKKIYSKGLFSTLQPCRLTVATSRLQTIHMTEGLRKADSQQRQTSQIW